MNYLSLALAIYVLLAAVLYIRYERTDHVGNRAAPPRRVIRYALPWYYSVPPGSHGNWVFGWWNSRRRRHYPEWGIRVLGFEYWVEYFR